MQIVCHVCNGVKYLNPMSCPMCEGTGRQGMIVCPTCNGTKVTKGSPPCPSCGGTGRLRRWLFLSNLVLDN